MKFGRRYQCRYFQPFCAEDKDLLDFGCANGLMLRTLAARRRIGVEVNPLCLAECRALNDATGVAVEVHKGLDEVASESVDVVISNHALEHVPDPSAVLREMRRVLRAKGALILVTPFDDFRSAGHRTWRPGDKNHHLFTWSPLNLGNLVDESGFQVVESRICTSAWSPRFFWVCRTLGMRAFRAACFLCSVLKHSREVLCVAVRP